MVITNSESNPPKRKPIHITLDERLSEEHRNKVKSVLENLFSMYERLANVKIARDYFGKPWCEDPNQPYCRPNYYIEKCRFSSNIVDAKCLLDLSKNEPWQQKEPHYEIYVIYDHIYVPGQPLPPVSIIFEVTYPAITSDSRIVSDIAGIVLSARTLELFYESNWPIAFYGIAAHGLGHLFGLPNPESPYYINSTDPRAKENPYYSNHCSYEYCMMRQASHYEDQLDFVRKILKNNPNLYCDYDLQQLRRNLNILFGRPNYTKDKNRIT